jgi:UDP-N-acetylmuramyl pentapeptide phosphotransferase/UDP-N-acetylglucosamine-1-phosphate transferase
MFPFLIALVLSFFMTKLMLVYLNKIAAFDVPNDRSSHSVPTPRGGGLGLGILMIIFLGLSFFFYKQTTIIWALTGFALLMLIGWLDDRKSIGILPRLLCQFGAVMIGSFSLPNDFQLFGGVLPHWLDVTLMIIGWVYFINLFNFMDGIDGLAAVQAMTCCIGAAILSYLAFGQNYTMMLSFVIAGLFAGFLFFNWHPAKIFLGDVGSLPFGFIIGFILIMLAGRGYAIPAFLLIAYYAADGIITMARRHFKGEKIWEAHRSHYYQKAAIAMGRHDKVVIWVLLANIACFGAAIASLQSPYYALLALPFIGTLLTQMSFAKKAS